MTAKRCERSNYAEVFIKRLQTQWLIFMHKLSNKTAWIFDLDGTLTIPVHDFAHMRRELGMVTDADILDTIAATQAELRKELTGKLDRLEAFYAAKAAPALGVKELLKYLADNECKLGIFTRNTKEMAVLSLEAIGIAQYFADQAIIGRDDAPHKPNPQGLLRLLGDWQMTVKDAVMVGDFKFDLEVGRAAGTATVHVNEDPRRWPELTDYHYPTLYDLHQGLNPSQ